MALSTGWGRGRIRSANESVAFSGSCFFKPILVFKLKIHGNGLGGMFFDRGR